MRKHLLLIVLAILMPVLAIADNMALKKDLGTFGYSSQTDSRLVISYDAMGYGSLPQTGAEDYTVAFWMKPISMFGSYGTTYFKYGSVIASFATLDKQNYSGTWCITMKKDKTIGLHGDNGVGFGSAKGVSTTGSVALDQWAYMAVVVDNTNKKANLYLNGESIYETSLSSPIKFTGSNGYFQFAGFGISGEIDEVQLFNAALSAEQLATAKDNPRAFTSLRAYYTFDEGDLNAGEFKDITGQTNVFAEMHRFSGTKMDTTNGGISTGTDAKTTAMTKLSDREVVSTDVTITVDDNIENGSIAVKRGEEILTGSQTLPLAEEVTLEAIPAEGYKLYDFYALSGEVKERIESPYKVVKDATLTADFTNEIYALTVENELALPYTITRHGHAVEDLTQMLGAGAEYKLTVEVPVEKVLNAVKLGEETLEAVDGVYTFTLTGDATLTIESVWKAKHVVTIGEYTNGWITVESNGVEIKSGEEVLDGFELTVTATPGPGQHFVSLKANGEEMTSDTYVLTAPVEFTAEFAEGFEYCIPQPVAGRSAGLNCTRTDRYITSIEVTAGENSITLEGEGNKSPRPVYKDLTSQVLVAQPGETVTFVTTGAGEWMHTHIYFDAGYNGFTQSDVVFTHGGSGNFNIAGTYSFNLPYGIKAGSYRVRYMVDWVGASPCEFGQASGDNGEAIIDFIIQIPSQDFETPRTISVAADNELGTVAITDPATEETSIETVQKKVTVVATPAEGAAFINWTTADGEFVANEPSYTYSEAESIALVAHFGYVVELTKKGEGSVSLAANGQTLVSGSVVAPATEVTVTATPVPGKVLIAVRVNGEDVATEAGVATIVVNAATNINVEFGEKLLTFAYTVNGKGRAYVCNGMDEGEEEDEDGNYPYVPGGSEVASGSAISSASRVYFFLAPNDGEELVSLMETQGEEENDVIDDVEQPEDGPYTLTDGTPAYVYSPSFSDNYHLVINFSDAELGAIDSILSDSEAGEIEFYNLEGVRVASDNLVPGIYVVRHGATTAKVLVK